jgi:hypothetical protein
MKSISEATKSKIVEASVLGIALGAVALIFGLIFIMLFANSDLGKELEIDYTDCYSSDNPKVQCKDVIANMSSCTCQIFANMTGRGDFELYYGLKNYSPNVFTYFKSRDDKQLQGYLCQGPANSCHPFDLDPNNRTFIPCGAIANNFFTDKIELFYERETGDWQQADLIRTGIASMEDKAKFKNPPLGNKTLEQVLKSANYTRPKNWPMDLWELDPENADNNGFQNEDFIVWMKNSPLPDFRKLYRRINHTGELAGGLDRRLLFVIDYRYDVTT